MPEFKVTDSTLNSYGFRILTQGIDCSLFDKNPLMLYMHRRFFDKNDPLPPGRWKNRKISGDVMTAEPEFDEKDEFAIKLKDKVDQGILNMASIGVDIIETSMDPKYLLPGQTRETVTKCILKEISIVDVGSNYNALKLYHNGKEVTLADGEDNEVLPLIKKHTNMKSIAIKLGLPENSTEDQILAKIGELTGEVAQLKTANSELTTAVNNINEAKALELVDGAIASKKITADKKDTFLKMAKNDYETAKVVIESMTSSVKPSDVILTGGNKSAADKKDDWKTLCAQGNTAVEKLKTEDPEKYAKLYRENYGFDPPRD